MNSTEKMAQRAHYDWMRAVENGTFMVETPRGSTPKMGVDTPHEVEVFMDYNIEYVRWGGDVSDIRQGPISVGFDFELDIDSKVSYDLYEDRDVVVYGDQHLWRADELWRVNVEHVGHTIGEPSAVAHRHEWTDFEEIDWRQ